MPNSTAYAAILLNQDAPEAEVDALVEKLKGIRGMHRVNVVKHLEIVSFGTVLEGSAAELDTGFRTVHFRGTDRGVMAGKNVVAMSGLESKDQNAQHDHEACLAAARKAGVPAEWSHRIETYLSM